MLPPPVVLSEHEREVLRRLQTPWGDAGAMLEREVLSRLAPGVQAEDGVQRAFPAGEARTSG